MFNTIFILSSLSLAILIFTIRPLKRFFADEENHRIIISIIAAAGFLFALLQVESIQSSLKEIFGRQKTEYFTPAEFKNFEVVTTKNGTRAFKVPLKEIPVAGSVTLWFSNSLVPPTYFEIENNFLLYKMLYDSDEEGLRNHANQSGLQYILTVVYYSD